MEELFPFFRYANSWTWQNQTRKRSWNFWTSSSSSNSMEGWARAWVATDQNPSLSYEISSRSSTWLFSKLRYTPWRKLLKQKLPMDDLLLSASQQSVQCQCAINFDELVQHRRGHRTSHQEVQRTGHRNSYLQSKLLSSHQSRLFTSDSKRYQHRGRHRSVRARWEFISIFLCLFYTVPDKVNNSFAIIHIVLSGNWK